MEGYAQAGRTFYHSVPVINSILHPVYIFLCHSPWGQIFLWAVFIYLFFSATLRALAAWEGVSEKAEHSRAAITSQSLHLPGRPTAKPRTLLEASKELPLEPFAKAEQTVGETPKDLVPPSCSFVPLFLRISWSPHVKPSQFSAG